MSGAPDDLPPAPEPLPHPVVDNHCHLDIGRGGPPWDERAAIDAAAAVGVRRLVIERRPVLVAWLLGWGDLIRRPHRVIPTALVGVSVLLLLTVPALVAAAVGWTRVRDVVLEGRDLSTTVVALVTWVGTWLGALVLAGIGQAFRSATWTLELPRRPDAGS